MFKQSLFGFSRTYFLELSSDYYEKDKEEILNLNNNLIDKFKNAILSSGNDSKDVLQGIEQLIYNLPKMITHTAYQDLLKKEKILVILLLSFQQDLLLPNNFLF